MPLTKTAKPALIKTLESVEIACTRDLYAAGQGESAETCGLQVADFGSALGTLASRIDVLALNRVIGLGVEAQATAGVIDQIVSWYSEADVPRFFVQVSPGPQATEISQWLTGRGFRHYNNWVRLCRDVQPPPEVRTDLTVELIDRRQASAFGRINAESFGWPPMAGPWLAQTVDRPGWRHYMAFDGTTPVATGALYTADQTGWLGYASTLASHRRRGAQGALLTRRIRDAAQFGCSMLSIETAQPTATRDVPSFRNALRAGFRESYARPNYIFEPGKG